MKAVVEYSGSSNAAQGLGNAGGSDPTIGAMMNAALYTTFAIFGYFGGLLFNIFGNRILLFFGGLTYMGYSVGVYAWGLNSSLGWLGMPLKGLAHTYFSVRTAAVWYLALCTT